MLLGFLRRTHPAKQRDQSAEQECSKLSEDSAYSVMTPAPDKIVSPHASQSSEERLEGLHVGGPTAAPVGNATPPVPEEHGLQASDFGRKAGAWC